MANIAFRPTFRSRTRQSGPPPYITSAVAMMECPDFLEFQDILGRMRSLDDKIIYALNTSVPTESFRKSVDATNECRELFSRIRSGRAQREDSIKKCITATADRVKRLREVKERDGDDIENLKSLKLEQTRLRLLQSELSVEEVIRERTLKLFNEKCRNYYKPETQ